MVWGVFYGLVFWLAVILGLGLVRLLAVAS